MQPSSGSDVPPGVQAEILDGRDSLRLVRIRLALTLIAVAILPFAAVAPIARAVLDDTRTGLEQRLAAEADHAAAEVRRELDGIRQTLESLAGSGAVVAALVAPAGDPAACPPRPSSASSWDGHPASLPALPSRSRAGSMPGRAQRRRRSRESRHPPPRPRSPWSRTERPRRPSRSPSPSPPPQPALRRAGSSRRSTLTRSSRGPALTLPQPGGRSRSSARRARSWRSWVPRRASTSRPPSSTWRPTARRRRPGWPRSACRSSTAGGSSPTAPLPVAAIPFPAVASLVGLLALLVGFIWWMGRQILRPAAELEYQHSRLHDLYESARVAALRDSLTGLGNHRSFQEAVARMVDQTRRYGTPFALCSSTSTSSNGSTTPAATPPVTSSWPRSAP